MRYKSLGNKKAAHEAAFLLKTYEYWLT